jgi:hypothetical protein
MPESESEFDFDSHEKIEVPVKVEGKKYFLREASGDAVCKYRNAQSKCMKPSANGSFTIEGPIADTEPLLVSLCLFDEHDRQVGVDVVRRWPNRVLKKLVEKLKQISELDIETGAPKNEQSDTPVGSV